jgi:hypothetical protein
MTWLYNKNTISNIVDFEDYDYCVEPDDEGVDIEVELDSQTEIDAYNSVIDKCRDIFLDRQVHGSFIENAINFPKEHECGLYEKCVRAIRNIESNEPVKNDTLIDLINYAVFVLHGQE